MQAALSNHCRAWALAFDNERRFQQWQAAYGEAAAAGQPQGAQADALGEEAQQLLQGLLDVLSGGGLESALALQQVRFPMPNPRDSVKNSAAASVPHPSGPQTA